MLTKKMTEILKRQAELVGKLTDGSATDADKKELAKLTETIDAVANADKIDVGKTKLSTMTIADFQKHVEAEQSALEGDTDPKRLALLKRNIEAVKGQGKSKPEDVVAVEVAVELTAEDRIAAVESKLDEVLAAIKGANFDRRTTTGVNDKPKDEPAEGAEGTEGAGTEGAADDDNGGTEKADDKPAVTAIANEAIDSVIAAFTAIKEKIASGAITVDELRKMWPSWSVQEMLEGAVAVLAKAETLAKLIDEVKPSLEKAADEAKAKPPEKCPKCGALMMGKTTCPACGWKMEAAKDGEGDDDKGDDKGDEGKGDDGKGDDGKGDKGDGTSTEKGAWVGGGDISPRTGGDTADYRAIRKRQ